MKALNFSNDIFKRNAFSKEIQYLWVYIFYLFIFNQIFKLDVCTLNISGSR